MAIGAGPPDQSHPDCDCLLLAAPQTVSPNRVGDLFDPETMKPRITEPVFVDALSPDLQRQDAARNQERTVVSVPVLGVADRLAAVTSSSRNAASAFKLLGVAGTPEVSSQLRTLARGRCRFANRSRRHRRGTIRSSTASERAELAKTLEAALSGNECLIVPRIPGVDEYMAALDRSGQRSHASTKPNRPRHLQQGSREMGEDYRRPWPRSAAAGLS